MADSSIYIRITKNYVVFNLISLGGSTNSWLICIEMMKRKKPFFSHSQINYWNGICVSKTNFLSFSCMFFYVKTDTLGSYKIRKKKLNFVSIDSHFRKMTNGKLVEISEININMLSLHLLLRLQIFYRWTNIFISFYVRKRYKLLVR